MNEQAGHACGVWTWQDGHLLDAHGTTVALARPGLLEVGRTQLLVHIDRSDMSLRLQATGPDGQVYTAQQASFSLNKLRATCGERAYRLERTRRLRRERAIIGADGTVIARTRPRGQALEIFDHEESEVIPDADFVFLTWACLEADNSGRVRI